MPPLESESVSSVYVSNLISSLAWKLWFSPQNQVAGRRIVGFPWPEVTAPRS